MNPDLIDLITVFLQHDFVATQDVDPTFIYQCMLLMVTDHDYVQIVFNHGEINPQINLTKAGMLIPLLDISAAFIASDTWQRTIDPDSPDPVDDPTSPVFLSPTDSPHRSEVFVIEQYNKDGDETSHFTYRRDGAGRVVMGSFAPLKMGGTVWAEIATTMHHLLSTPLDLGATPNLTPEGYIKYLVSEGHVVRHITL